MNGEVHLHMRLTRDSTYNYNVNLASANGHSSFRSVTLNCGLPIMANERAAAALADLAESDGNVPQRVLWSHESRDAQLVEYDMQKHRRLIANAVAQVSPLVDTTRRRFTLYGKECIRHRFETLFGVDGVRTHRLSGHEVEAQPFPSAVAELVDVVNRVSGMSFNAVLVSVFRNGSDYAAKHRENDVDATSTLCLSYSLPENVRTLRIRCHETDKIVYDAKTLPFHALHMKGSDFRTLMTHEILKAARVAGPRIAFTFGNCIIDMDTEEARINRAKMMARYNTAPSALPSTWGVSNCIDEVDIVPSNNCDMTWYENQTARKGCFTVADGQRQYAWQTARTQFVSVCKQANERCAQMYSDIEAERVRACADGGGSDESNERARLVAFAKQKEVWETTEKLKAKAWLNMVESMKVAWNVAHNAKAVAWNSDI